MEYLIKKIEQWAEDRNIIKGTKPIDQAMKLFSEFGELADNVGKGRDCRDDIGDVFVVLTIISAQLGETISEISVGDIKWSYGDKSLVSELCGNLHNFVDAAKIGHWNYSDLAYSLELIKFLANSINSSLEECVQIAYNDIKDRKGIVSNGVFIKESDPVYAQVIAEIEGNYNV